MQLCNQHWYVIRAAWLTTQGGMTRDLLLICFLHRHVNSTGRQLPAAAGPKWGFVPNVALYNRSHITVLYTKITKMQLFLEQCYYWPNLTFDLKHVRHSNSQLQVHARHVFLFLYSSVAAYFAIFSHGTVSKIFISIFSCVNIFLHALTSFRNFISLRSETLKKERTKKMIPKKRIDFLFFK